MMDKIEILGLRDGEVKTVASIPCDDASHNTAIMGKDELVISVVTDSPLNLIAGDYALIDGVIYRMNRDAELTQKSDVQHEYALTFEAPIYTLIDKILCNKITGSTAVTLTGKLRDFLELLIWNVNYDADSNPLGVDTGWEIGLCPDTDYMNITLETVKCRDALDTFASKYGLEYYATNKTINYVSHIENETGLVFTQGKGGGLYEVEQKNVDEGDLVTRAYIKGGTDNVIPGEGDLQGRLVLPEGYIENFSESSRVVEAEVEFSDIHPTFQGIVGTVSGDNNREFLCPEMDFDIADVAVGDEARVNFLTGDLLGKSFEFKWDNTLKKITLIYQEDDLAAIDADTGKRPNIPSTSKYLRGGELFNFTGLKLSGTYKTNAITKLREKGTEWLAYYCRKHVKFELNVDYRYLRKNKIELHCGDLITINIPLHNISKLIRITELERNLHTGKITCTVSNYLDEKWKDRIESQIVDVKSTVTSTSHEVDNTATNKLNKSIFNGAFGLHYNKEGELESIEALADLWTKKSLSAKGLSIGSGSGSSGATTLGGLNNVGSWADEVPTTDRIMIQVAGSTHWASKNLADIVGLDTAALQTYLNNNNYAKVGDIPSLSGYATQDWVMGKGYATTTGVSTALTNKVDKITGKGLSTNDFTSTLLDKLNGIESGSNKYVLPTASSRVLGGVKIGNGISIISGVIAVNLAASDIPTIGIDKVANLQSALNVVSSKVDNFLEGSDTDGIINKWKELESFLSGQTQSSTLANLLAVKADKSILISTGTGLTGGGTLSSNRTLSLLAASATTLGGIKVGTNLSIDSKGVLSNTYTYKHPIYTSIHILNSNGKVLSGITTNTLGHVTGVTYKTLAATDIPTLSIGKISNLQKYLDSKLDTAYFKRIFGVLDANDNELAGNDMTTVIDSLKLKVGTWTEEYFSIKGQNPGTGGSVSLALSQLADVSLSSPGNGESLVYSSSLGKWINGVAGLSKVTVKLGNVSYDSVNGTVSLPAYATSLPASDVYSWAKQSSKPSYSFSELSNHPTTILGYGITDNIFVYDKQLTVEDLNTITNRGLYYSAGSNSVINKPSHVDAFGMFSFRTAAGWYSHLLLSSNTYPGLYYNHNNSASWVRILDSRNFNVYTPTLTGLGASGTWNININGNANTLNNIHSSQFLRNDINNTTNSSTKLWLRGSINSQSGSTATLQVNGFMRTGEIFIHEGGVTPTASAKALSNVSGNICWDGKNILNASNYSSYALPLAGGTMNGALYNSNANALVLTYGSRTSFIRNDGNATYLLLTDEADNGTTKCNSLRPLYVSNSNGRLYSKNGQTFEGGTVITALTVTGNSSLAGTVQLDKIGSKSGNSIVIGAGESYQSIPVSTSEWLTLGGESGVEVYSSPDNMSSGFDGMHRAILLDAAGNTTFPKKVTATSFSGDGNAISNVNAYSLQGIRLTPSSSTDARNTVGYIRSDGVMEIGFLLDFHRASDTSDYSTRLQADGWYSNIVHLPHTSGTLALTTDTVSNASNLGGYAASTYLKTDGNNSSISLSGGGSSGSVQGYRKILEWTIDGWDIKSMSLLIHSRHSGQGILYVSVNGNDANGDTIVHDIRFLGATNSNSLLSGSFGEFYAYFNPETHKFRLYWSNRDFNTTWITVLGHANTLSNELPTNGAWLTEMPADNGTELPVRVNEADYLKNAHTLWGHDFDGRQDISGELSNATSLNYGERYLRHNIHDATILSASNASIVLRPNGDTTDTGSFRVKADGSTVTNGTATINGNVHASTFIIGYDWTSKTDAFKCGVDGINGGIDFYNGINPYSASIFREDSDNSNFYVGVRSGTVSNGITIDYTGKVGIYNTNPSHALDVNGIIYSSSTINASGNIESANGRMKALYFITDANNNSPSYFTRTGGNAAIYVQQVDTSGTIADFRYGSSVPGQGTEVFRVTAGEVKTLNRKPIISDSYIATYGASSGSSGTAATYISNGSIELSHPTPFIDFHYGNSTADYTTRLIENASGRLNVSGEFYSNGALHSNTRIYTGYDSGIKNSMSCSGWFRSSGNTGWYNQTYGGGIYMEDTTWVRVHNGKSFYVPNEIYAGVGIWTAGYLSGKGQNTTSDGRLKRVISKANLSVEAISKAPDIIFAWRDGSGIDVGSIAQYWRKILPASVKEFNSHLTFNYGGAAIVGLISVAKKVVNHEERIKELENENMQLKQTISNLERRLSA